MKITKKLSIATLNTFCAIALLIAVNLYGADQSHQIDSININTANAVELSEAISGVGIKKAKAIVSYREENGDFGNANELVNVKGIGEKIILDNARLLKTNDS